MALMNSTPWLVTSSFPSFNTLTGEVSGTLDTPWWSVVVTRQGINEGLGSFISLS